ncbi:hypothetical protein D3C73_1072700 [compost metagenome]
MAAGNDFYQHTFTAATAVEPRDTRQGTVAIEYQAHLRRAEEQVVAAIVRDKETETIAVAGDTAADQVQFVYRGICAAPGIDKLAVTLHGAQTTAQGFDLVFFVKTELGRQLLACGRFATVGKALQDQLTAGDRVVVFFRFASGLGIEGLPIGHQKGFTLGYIDMNSGIGLLKPEMSGLDSPSSMSAVRQ